MLLSRFLCVIVLSIQYNALLYPHGYPHKNIYKRIILSCQIECPYPRLHWVEYISKRIGGLWVNHIKFHKHSFTLYKLSCSKIKSTNILETRTFNDSRVGCAYSVVFWWAKVCNTIEVQYSYRWWNCCSLTYTAAACPWGSYIVTSENIVNSVGNKSLIISLYVLHSVNDVQIMISEQKGRCCNTIISTKVHKC